ncbi:MAG: hypothetical protein HZA31_01470 [Opitutae bacterium]|nr:hypothetical protein [Opitutae bacterium]
MNAPETAASLTPPTPARSGEAPGWRLLRYALAIGLALALTFLLGLAIAGWSLTVRSAVLPLLTGWSRPPEAPLAAGLMAFLLLTPMVLLALLLRLRRGVWAVLGGGWVVVIPTFVWLAWDDTEVRLPVTCEELAPPFPEAEKSYAVLMRYSERSSGQQAKGFASPDKLSPWTGNPDKGEAWRADIVKNRTTLEADWALLAPGRQWWAELNAFEQIGDLTPPNLKADFISFQVWYSMAQRCCAIAGLQALDGQGDAAVATLLPALQLGRKLQPASRTLIRTLIGRAVEKMAMQTASFILDHATLSASAWAQLTAALAGDDGAAGARRLVLMEPVFWAPISVQMRLGDIVTPQQPKRSSLAHKWLNLLSPFLYNTRASTNLRLELLSRLAKLAEARALKPVGTLGDALKADLRRQHGMKNLAGRKIVQQALFSFEKAAQSYWETQDMRVALRERLAALPPQP